MAGSTTSTTAREPREAADGRLGGRAEGQLPGVAANWRSRPGAGLPSGSYSESCEAERSKPPPATRSSKGLPRCHARSRARSGASQSEWMRRKAKYLRTRSMLSHSAGGKDWHVIALANRRASVVRCSALRRSDSADAGVGGKPPTTDHRDTCRLASIEDSARHRGPCHG